MAALDAVVAALAHPARRQILLTIHFRGEATAGEIAGRFAHKWPTTTRHLRVLEDARPRAAGEARQEPCVYRRQDSARTRQRVARLVRIAVPVSDGA